MDLAKICISKMVRWLTLGESFQDHRTGLYLRSLSLISKWLEARANEIRNDFLFQTLLQNLQYARIIADCQKLLAV